MSQVKAPGIGSAERVAGAHALINSSTMRSKKSAGQSSKSPKQGAATKKSNRISEWSQQQLEDDDKAQINTIFK